MQWENILIILAVLGIIIIYFWPNVQIQNTNISIQNNTNNSVQNITIQNFDYIFKVNKTIGSKTCPYEYPAYNSAILVNKNGTPLNISLVNQFIGVNGVITEKQIPTCTCDSYLSSITNCTIGEQLYMNATVLMVKNYKVISNSSIYSCNSNSDCIPATCCHPKICVNKAYAPNCKNAICTTMMVPNTLDYGKCECINNACEAVINFENPLK